MNENGAQYATSRRRQSTQAEMRAMLREQIAKVKPMVDELKLVVQ